MRSTLLGAMLITSVVLSAGTSRSADDIVVGVSAPLSGAMAIFGRSVVDGAVLAVSDINAAGGVLGRHIELDILDDQCNPQQSAAGTRRMVEEKKVSALIGYPCVSIGVQI
jgi:branched-chain amino acid transport system substrate-binding protein